MKKILAILLALTMIVGLAASALAASITINAGDDQVDDGATNNIKYNAYKIFDYVKADDSTYTGTTTEAGPGEGTGLTYFINADSPWYDVVVACGYFTLTPYGEEPYEKYYVALKDQSMNTAEGAKTIAEYLRDNIGEIEPDYADFAAGEEQTVEDGYYLITSSLGQLVIAATSNVEITEKNSYPTLDKEAEEADYSVGDKVPYTITVEIPADVDNEKDITVHDKLDDVLVFDAESLKVSIDGAEPVELDGTICTLVENPEDGECTFEIVIDTAEISAATTLVFTYEAELTSAALKDTGYVNEAYLDYSDYETPHKIPEVKTFGFELEKVFTGTEDELEATFTLSDADGAITFIKDDTGYVKADSDDEGGSTEITVKNGETVEIRGLAAGEYTLTETETDSAYNLISGTITVTIDENGSASFSTLDLVESSDGKVTVTNNNGTVLPSTGGIGTTIFYIVGGLLAVGAGVVLVSKKRMSKEDI